MSIKRLITADEHKTLHAQIQSEYKKQEDGSFVLDLTDWEDPAALKRAKDHERDQAKEAKAALKKAQEELHALTEERDGMLAGSIPKADAEKLTKSWEKKLADREKELSAQIDDANKTLQTLLVDNVAQSVATEISNAPVVIMPHIKSRLRAVKNSEGKFETQVVDMEGKPSALTVTELKKEFVLNKDYSAIITASKASGGGAGGGGGGGGAHGGKIDFGQSPSAIVASLKASGKIKD